MSVDQVTGLAGGVSGAGLGSITGTLQGSLNNLLSAGGGYLDRFFPPEKREQWKAWLTKFATERPYLASFLLSQIALSGPALALFAIMTITVVIFSLLAGILVGLIGALLFVVFALGVALIILLPTLFFTTAAAVFIWLWGMGTYYIVKWFNQKEIPGVHTDAVGGLLGASGAKDLPLPNLNGDHVGKAPPKLDKPANGQSERSGSPAATSTGAQHHTDGKENQSHARKSTGRPQSIGSKANIPDVGGNVTGTLGDTRKKIGVL